MIQKEEYLYSAIYSTHYSQRAQTWITQLYLQITPCLPDGLPRYVRQLQVERGTGKVRRPKTDVLPLCHATKVHIQMSFQMQVNIFIYERRKYVSFFSERLSYVCRLSVMLVHPTQAVAILGNISTDLVPWPSVDIH